MRSLSALFIALSLAACGGSSSGTASETTSTETASTSGSETEGGEAAPRFATVTIDQVATRLDAHDPTLAVYDANGRETFDEHHVPGATWVHYDSVTADVLPADHATSLVFYCGSEQCTASHVAADTALDLGYTDVSVMTAGISGWIAAGKPVEAAAPAAQ
jgi:rhodanese-related sulfurtransferase